MKIGLIGGTSLHDSDLFASWARLSGTTDYGEVVYRAAGELVVLDRHGPAGTTPPHAIDHRANIMLLRDLGVTSVISLCSVGSLRPGLIPGAWVSCSDYVSFRPVTFQEKAVRPVAPAIRNDLLPDIVESLPFPVETGQVYVQTRGPRFETPAEIRIIREWGDVVGMTFAGEADLCAEAGLACNSLAVVDNFANGIAGAPLSAESFREQVRRNREKVEAVLERLVDLYG